MLFRNQPTSYLHEKAKRFHIRRVLRQEYPKFCIEEVQSRIGLYDYHSSQEPLVVKGSGPSVNTEDHIRDLCARLIAASDDQDVSVLSEQLREALRAHAQMVRGKLIRASSLVQHTPLPPEKDG